MRLACAGLLCLFLISCREIAPVQIPVTVTGYRIQGTVASVNGIPLKGAQVSLYYYLVLVDTTPSDTPNVIVPSEQSVIDISVFTTKNQFIRHIALSTHPAPGILPHIFWDGRDQYGIPVPSGKYLIRYMVDSVIIKFSPVLIQGHPTAVTDDQGRFTITGDYLPVGAVFDFYLSDGSFDGVYEVQPSVDIGVQTQNTQTYYGPVDLVENDVTSVALTL